MIRIFIACLLVATPFLSFAYPINDQLTGFDNSFPFECNPPNDSYANDDLYEVFIYPTDSPGSNIEMRCDGTIVSNSSPEIVIIDTAGRIFNLYATYAGQYTVEVYEPDGINLFENFTFMVEQAPTPPVVASTSELARLADAGEAFVLSWYFVMAFGLVLAVFILFPTRTRYDY